MASCGSFGRAEMTASESTGKKRGRRKGSPNKMNVYVRQMVLLAAESVGEVQVEVEFDNEGKKIATHVKNGPGGVLGYFKFLAKHYPQTYGSLLRKMMPPPIPEPAGAGEDESVVDMSRDQLVSALEQRGIPVDRMFDRGPVIEHRRDRK